MGASTTVAGAPLTPFWAWRCPDCVIRLSDGDQGVLAGKARGHFLAKHGPLEGQLTLSDEPGRSSFELCSNCDASLHRGHLVHERWCPRCAAVPAPAVPAPA